jgi:sphingomyelin phosphodiesterase acid-like 3
MACKLRGIDTLYSLFASAISAIHRDAAGASFIPISGDLLSHRFDYMFAKALPGATPEQSTVFTAKTNRSATAQKYCASFVLE